MSLCVLPDIPGRRDEVISRRRDQVGSLFWNTGRRERARIISYGKVMWDEDILWGFAMFFSGFINRITEGI
jgi:hypothetical protein